MINPLVSGSRRPRLTLVGAGPGDPDLITIKGLRALASADIVLYDTLVSEAVLQHAPKGVSTVSVGKRAGMHVYTQDEINELIVKSAFRHGHVVRLKGGDPFIFGRGHEEIEYARAHGLDVEVVPGISSALAVPENLGIPLTRRGVSESFWVVTGTTQSGDISDDVAHAAQSTSTVVVLMGMRRIREIMDVFARHGRGSAPVVVIQNGTLPEERWITGTVSTIGDKVHENHLSSPSVIVIGEVARYAYKAAAKHAGPTADDIRRTA